MNADILSRLDAVFAESPVLRAGSVPSETEVLEAVQVIGIPFDQDYKEFLLRYGGAMVGPYPIFGLRPVKVMDETLWSVVDVTRHYRSMQIEGAGEWVIISEDHAGNPIGMDKNGAVWIYDHDFQSVSLLAKSFEQYVRNDCLKLV